MTPWAICARFCVVPNGTPVPNFAVLPAVAASCHRSNPPLSSNARASWPHLHAGAERQQGDVARLLDGRGKPPLVRGAHSAQTARHDLAAFRHKLREQAVVLIVNRINFLDAEFAHLLAAKILATAFTRPAGSASTTRSGSGRRCRWSGGRGCGSFRGSLRRCLSLSFVCHVAP